MYSTLVYVSSAATTSASELPLKSIFAGYTSSDTIIENAVIIQLLCYCKKKLIFLSSGREQVQTERNRYRGDEARSVSLKSRVSYSFTRKKSLPS